MTGEEVRAIEDAVALARFEALVLSQQPASRPWEPVTDYSLEARRAIEGQHPDRIATVFQPRSVADVGCGPGHLVTLLRERGIDAIGFDKSVDRDHGTRLYMDITLRHMEPLSKFELVICREVFEHLTIREIRRAVENLCDLSTRFVYLTTRFAKHPTHLLDVDTADDLDPTHISMMNQTFLRTLFVLEGFKRRADLEQQMDWMKKGRCLVYERV